MRLRVLVLLFVIPISLLAQTIQDTTAVDERYLEDQFYAGLTYNFILNLPNEVSQRNLSYGLQAGFIKDFPLNQSRNIGLGVGLGLGLNTNYTNIRAQEVNGDISYGIPDSSIDAKRSKIETHLLEVPLEFRWRNSNPTDYNFWRIYTGIKLSYLINARSKFVGVDASNQKIKDSFNNDDLRKIQYGLTFNVGYYNVNLHIYYALTGLFKDQVFLDTEELKVKPLRIGFVVYML